MSSITLRLFVPRLTENISPEVRTRAVRLNVEHEEKHPLRWAAMLPL